MDESFALHQEAYDILEKNRSDPNAAIAQLRKLEEDTRDHREDVRKKLKSSLEELTDQERKAFREKAMKRYKELSAKFGTIIQEYPQEKQAQIQSLVSQITR